MHEMQKSCLSSSGPAVTGTFPEGLRRLYFTFQWVCSDEAVLVRTVSSQFLVYGSCFLPVYTPRSSLTHWLVYCNLSHHTLKSPCTGCSSQGSSGFCFLIKGLVQIPVQATWPCVYQPAFPVCLSEAIVTSIVEWDCNQASIVSMQCSLGTVDTQY